jgi:hypothetical protein
MARSLLRSCSITTSRSFYAAVPDSIAVLRQGGYDLKALGESVADTFRGLLGEPSGDTFSPDLLREEPMVKVKMVLEEARRIHGL